MDREYLIVIPIEQRWRGSYKRGEQLPLHCTVMPWFRFKERPDMLRVCKQLLSTECHEQIELVSARRELFGPESNIPVHVLEESPALSLLHTELLMFLAEVQVLFGNNVNIIGANYRAHVTDRDTKTFPSGTKCIGKHLIFIQRDQARKVIVGKYSLKKINL